MTKTTQINKKILSILTLACFLVSQVSGFASPNIVGAPSSLAGEIAVRNLIQDLSIPQELGTIQERFSNADSSTDAPMVVHIQDAHANYEAQKNIEAIINYLNRTYGISLVLLEGGAEKLDPNLLKIFKNPEYNSEMIDSLLKKGEVTGAEAYLAQSTYEAGKDIDVFGIEKAEFYRKDLEHFRSIWPNTEKGRAFVERTIQLIDRAGSRTVNNDLRDFLKEWQSFKESRSHLNSYLNILKARAKEILKLDLSNVRNQREWPNLIRVYKLKEMEKELNLKEAKVDWQKAKEFLKSININPVLLKELENKLYGRKSDFLNGVGSSRDLFQYLLDVAGERGFSFENYPELTIWVGSVILQSEVESDELFAEIEKLNNQILDKLAPTPQEKHIIELFRQNYLLQDLFALELTRDNLARVKAAEELFKPSEVIRRIEAIDPTTDFGDVELIQVVEKLYFDCLKSYDFALMRESAFLDNLSSAIKKTGKNKAITVCGGFHTKGFAEIFKANKISYAVISPRITVFDNVEKEHENYINSLMQIVPTQSATVSTRSKPTDLAGNFAALGGIGTYVQSKLRRAVDEVAGVRNLGRNDLSDSALPALGLGKAVTRAQIGGAVVEKGRFGPQTAKPGVKSELRIADRETPTADALGRLLTVASVVSGGRFAPAVNSKSELRADRVIRSETVNGVEIILREQTNVGLVLSIRESDPTALASPALTFEIDQEGQLARDAFERALAIAGQQPNGEVGRQLAARVRSDVDSLVSNRRSGVVLTEELEARSELREKEQNRSLPSSVSEQFILKATGYLLAKSELRLVTDQQLNTILSGVVGPTGVSLLASNTAVSTGQLESAIAKLHLAAAPDVYSAKNGLTDVKVIRIFRTIPDLEALSVEMELAALNPETFNLVLFVENVANDADFSVFEVALRTRFADIRSSLGFQAIAQLPFSVSRGVPSSSEFGKNFTRGVPVAVVSEDPEFLSTNFKAGESRFYIHDDIPTGQFLEKKALSLLTARIIFGIQENLSQFEFRTRPYRATELFRLTQTLTFLREVAQKLATAA